MNATAEIIPLQPLTKRCPQCTKMLPRVEFYGSTQKKDGCSSYCRECTNRICTERYKESRRRAQHKFGVKRWKQSTREQRREMIVARFERHVKAYYGLTIEIVRTALQQQHGMCANRACGIEISLDVHGREANRAVIDHCHETGLFRGLLCRKCNHAEGFYQTNKNRIIGIVEYLDRSVK